VTPSVFEVSIQIEVTIQVAHRFFQVIHDVSDIFIRVQILIVRSVDLIVQKLVIARVCPRMTFFQLL
jgi:hypothetical protein